MDHIPQQTTDRLIIEWRGVALVAAALTLGVIEHKTHTISDTISEAARVVYETLNDDSPEPTTPIDSGNIS